MNLKMTRQQMRTHARVILKGNWSLLTLVYTVLTIVPSLFYGMMVLSSQNTSNVSTLVILSFGSFMTVLMSVWISVALVAYSIDLVAHPDPHITLSVRIKRIMAADVIAKMFYVQLLVSIRILLWLLLLIVPGFVMSYAYSQAIYIAHDSVMNGDNKSASQCIYESRRMMDGAKLNLFNLSMSFVGWYIVAAIVVSMLGVSDITVLNSTLVQYGMALFVQNAILGLVIVYMLVTQYVFYIELKRFSAAMNKPYGVASDEDEIIIHD